MIKKYYNFNYLLEGKSYYASQLSAPTVGFDLCLSPNHSTLQYNKHILKKKREKIFLNKYLHISVLFYEPTLCVLLRLLNGDVSLHLSQLHSGKGMLASGCLISIWKLSMQFFLKIWPHDWQENNVWMDIIITLP